MSRKKLLYSEIFQRIELLRESLGISQIELSRKCKISPSFYSEIKTKRSDVNSTILINIARAFPKVNIKWIINGEGDMFIQDSKIAEIDANYGKNDVFEGIPRDKIDDFKALINALKRLIF